MKTLCYSVRLESLISISEKAYLARSYDGREAIIPKSQVFGMDEEVTKSDAWWVSAWILSKKDIQYSGKKQAWFNSNGMKLPRIEVNKHTPEKINTNNVQPDDSLIR